MQKRRSLRWSESEKESGERKPLRGDDQSDVICSPHWTGKAELIIGAS